MDRQAARRPSQLWLTVSLMLVVLLGHSLGVGSQVVEVGEPIQLNPYCTLQMATENGKDVAIYTIVGPPEAPPGFERTVVALPEPDVEAGINILAVPAFTWVFGCSATSAAMIAGYYDRTSHSNMYVGPTNGGVMPLDNSSWGTWVDGCSATRAQCPLSATRDGLDGRTTRGHVDDYWNCSGSTATDPYVGNWTEHTWGECTADYMMTSRSELTTPIADGGTRFYYYVNNSPWSGTPSDGADGGYGLELFYESRGYTATSRYNQRIYGYGGISAGFTYTQYKAEIDAGRPVMIHVTGHTMVGIGYNDTSSDLMYIHDTWNYGTGTTHTMIWGGDYSGMTHKGVTIVTLSATASPEIDVQRSAGTSITDGGADSLGSKRMGVPATVVYTVVNNGAAALSVTGATASNLTGCSGFAVNTAMPISVAVGGGSATLSISITPNAASFGFDLDIANNDGNENPYDIAVQGDGIAPPTPPTAAVFRVDSSGNVLADQAFYGASFQADAADVAEWVLVSEPVEAGDVLELDPENPQHYRRTTGSCSSLVAGVVSTQPGVLLGSPPSPDHLSATTDYALLALIGIVPVKACDEGGPIEPGDLLVPASIPGYVRRWNPEDNGCPLVGKALAPLEQGESLISILLVR